MRSIFKKPKTNILRRYLLPCSNIYIVTCNRTDVSFLNKLASKVWKKKCTNFLYTMICKNRIEEQRTEQQFVLL